MPRIPWYLDNPKWKNTVWFGPSFLRVGFLFKPHLGWDLNCSLERNYPCWGLIVKRLKIKQDECEMYLKSVNIWNVLGSIFHFPVFLILFFLFPDCVIGQRLYVSVRHRVGVMDENCHLVPHSHLLFLVRHMTSASKLFYFSMLKEIGRQVYTWKYQPDSFIVSLLLVLRKWRKKY
jgi:hypothetical protein